MCSDGAFLEAAASIARRIVTDAVWHGGRCSWVGAVVDARQRWRLEYRALGPQLYDGTAGVGLFLAQLYAATGDAAFRRAAVGAMRHAVERASALPPDRRDGFHAGSLGVAWAADRTGELLDEDELRASVRRVRVAAIPLSGPGRCPDVVLGAAGTILAQLALADALHDEDLVEDALASGDELIDHADVTRHGWSWATPGRRYPHHLCGLSHGAAGIGWALLELFAATGEERFREAAEGAFAYERSWLDVASGTWPDLRIAGQRRGASGRVAASAAAGTWCHGEGGIALARLRAHAVLAVDGYARDAELALETTRRELAAALPFEIDDFTLCHGAAGTADALLCGEAALGGRWHDAAELAPALALAAIERHGVSGDWPCGASGGTAPGLFRGLAGIAWWLLRLHDRATPSPLTLPISG
jgi:lantibiotic modifying enzyme